MTVSACYRYSYTVFLYLTLQKYTYTQHIRNTVQQQLHGSCTSEPWVLSSFGLMITLHQNRACNLYNIKKYNFIIFGQVEFEVLLDLSCSRFTLKCAIDPNDRESLRLTSVSKLVSAACFSTAEMHFLSQLI